MSPHRARRLQTAILQAVMAMATRNFMLQDMLMLVVAALVDSDDLAFSPNASFYHRGEILNLNFVSHFLSMPPL
jgi:hypothetical protein